MAVGKSQARVDQRLLSISMGGVLIAHRGQRVAGYTESIVNQHLMGSDIEITVDLGLGSGRARVWTCDLTHEYIRINVLFNEDAYYDAISRNAVILNSLDVEKFITRWSE